MEQWCRCKVRQALVRYRDTGELSPDIVPVLQCWIEAQVSLHGSDLDREETIQALWEVTLDRLIPQLKTAVRVKVRKRGGGKRIRVKRLDWHSFMLLSLRREIGKMRRIKHREERTFLHTEEMEDD